MATITLINNTYLIPSSYVITGVNLTSTVITFKQVVQNQTNLTSGQLNLTYNGESMLNDRTLASYGIQLTGSVIQNTSSIIFLITESDNKTYNVNNPNLSGTVFNFKSKAILDYGLNSIILRNLYFGSTLLTNTNVLSSSGIGYGATLVAKPSTTSGGGSFSTSSTDPINTTDTTRDVVILPTPVTPGVNTLLPNETFCSEPIVNPLITNIINTSQVINYGLNLGSSNKSYIELISTSQNLNVVIEYYGYTSSVLTRNQIDILVKSGQITKAVGDNQVNEVLVSFINISPVRATGTTTVCYSYKNTSINPNNLSVPPRTYVQKINYKITNNSTTSSFKFKCLIGFIINTNTLA